MAGRSSKAFFQILAIALFLGGLSCLGQLATAPIAGQAFRSVSEADTLEVTLPQTWNGPANELASRRFTLRFGLAASPDTPLYLYVPSYAQRLGIAINGTPIDNGNREVNWKGPMSYAATLVQLPSLLLKTGENRLDLTVTTGPLRMGSLSSLYIGEKAELEPHFRQRAFLRYDLKVILFGVQSFLALCCFVLVAMQPKETGLLWLGMTMATSCLFSLGIFSTAFPAILVAIPWFLVLISTAAICFLGFACDLAGIRRPRTIALAAAGLPILAYAMILSGLASKNGVILWFVLPVSVLALLVALPLLTRLFWRHCSLDLVFLVPGVMLVVFAVLHDQLNRLGYLNTGIMLAMPARLLTLVGLAVFLMLRLANTSRELDQAARTLAERLRQREEELASIFSRDRAEAEQAASATERRRITAELHDGVAGHLSTIVALSDSRDAAPQDIQVLARHALSELRMVIDTLDMPEADLRVALAAMCERSLTPLRRLGIKTDWSFLHLPEMPWLTADQMLSVVRILQEALANAVRHANPRSLEILAQDDGGDTCTIRVINRGGTAPSVRVSKRGQGLRNMAQRAADLGGFIHLQPFKDGAEFRLNLPKRTKN